MAGVEGGLTGQRLRIDQQPGLTRGRQHVVEVEVPVGEDGLSGPGREVAAHAHGLINQATVERTPQRIEFLG